MKKRKYKLLSIVGVIAMLISLFPVTLQAQTPTLSFEFPYPLSYDKNDKWNVGIDQTVHTEIDFANYSRMYVDNKKVRCSQLGIIAVAGAQYTVDLLDTKEYPETVKEKLKDIEAFGYGMNNDTSDEMDFATSIRIWQELNTYNSNEHAKPTHIHPDIQNKIDIINQRLSIKEKNVSFQNNTIQLIGYGEKYGITLNDSENVFQHYINKKIDGVHYKRSGNTIKVWVERGNNPSGTLEFQLFPTNKSDVSLAYSSVNKSQDVIYLSGAKPKTMSISYQVNEGEVELKKQDIETGTISQGNASLFENGNYRLYYAKDVVINNTVVHKQNELVSEKNIGKDLRMEWKHLICADYYIQESNAPTGYLLDSTKHYFSINKNNKKVTLLSKEQVKKQGAEIIKISSNGESSEVIYLEGAEFSGKLLSEVNEKGKENAAVVTTVTTDKNGYAKIPELPYGTYIFYETKTPEGYLTAQPFIIEITQDSRDPLPVRVVNNVPFEAYIHGIKQNGATAQTITLTSAVFELYDSNGDVVSFKLGTKELTKLSTDENGVFSTPLKIKSGVYTIKEIETPKGFIKLELPITVTVSNDTISYDDKGNAFVEIKISNERPEGKVLLSKVFEENENLDDETLEAGFEIRTSTPIIDPTDGSVEYEKGSIIKNPNREDGLFVVKQYETIEIDHLPIGAEGSTFIFSEKILPTGYQKIEDFTIEFKITDDTTKTYTIQKEVENKIITMDIEIIKTNEFTNEVILDKDFEFTMYEDIECTKVVESAKGDLSSGSVYFSDIPYGSTRYFKETSAPEGYILSDEVIKVVFDEQYLDIGSVIQIEYTNKPIPKISTLAKGKANQKTFDPSVKNTILDVTHTEDFDTSITYDRTTEVISKKDNKAIFTINDTVSFEQKDTESIIELVIPANTVTEDGDYYIAQHYYDCSNGELYLSHNDANDKNQSIKFQTKKQPKTYDTTYTSGWLSLIGLSIITITSLLYWNKKKVKK